MSKTLIVFLFLLSLSSGANIVRVPQGSAASSTTETVSSAAASSSAPTRTPTTASASASAPTLSNTSTSSTAPAAETSLNLPPNVYEISPPFYLSLFPSNTSGTDDNTAYLKNVILGTQKLPYIGSVGESVSTKDEATQFVIINADDEGYLTSFDSDTGLPERYYGDTSSEMNFRNFSSLKFLYSYQDLIDEGEDVNGTFSIEYYSNSPLYPYARTLQFNNPGFGVTCGNNAIFCSARNGDQFTIGRDIEAYGKLGLRPGCGKIYLVVECVTPNCFVNDDGGTCLASDGDDGDDGNDGNDGADNSASTSVGVSSSASTSSNSPGSASSSASASSASASSASASSASASPAASTSASANS